MRIAIVGTGYVGLVAGACFATTGNTIHCVDIDEKKIEDLKQGIIPIYEPGLEDIVEDGIKKERLLFTTDLAEAVRKSDLIFIAVGTPPNEDGSADLQHVLAVAEGIGKSMDGFKVVVDKSTVPVGTAQKVKEAILKHTDHEVAVASNPEFLKEGDAINDFLKPDRVVLGSDDERAKEMLDRLYRPFVRTGSPIIHMDVVSAELTKYAANAFLATKISFMNELSRLCERVGADIENVRFGISTDQRIGKHFLFAGAGYGGSCFPKDVKAIIRTANEYGMDLKIINSTEVVNEEQKSVLVDKIVKHYDGNLQGKVFAIWGLSFKPRTDDMREAPAIVIINSLLEAGASVRAFDPEAMDVSKGIFGDSITFCDSEYEACEGADALALVTEWQDFRTPDFDKLATMLSDKVLFDGRNIWNQKYARTAGLAYYGIGRRVEEN
ncbi:UDP-glucose/GDP-mannose dehydrogenase family protein [bacterium]|nr:UDP-glucose/GDP-mannose dehydrogenase family protein [bacterium]